MYMYVLIKMDFGICGILWLWLNIANDFMSTPIAYPFAEMPKIPH